MEWFRALRVLNCFLFKLSSSVDGQMGRFLASRIPALRVPLNPDFQFDSFVQDREPQPCCSFFSDTFLSCGQTFSCTRVHMY